MRGGGGDGATTLATLVIGGASGIGRAAALRLAGSSAQVAIADIDLRGAESTAGMCGAASALALECDAGEPASLRAAVGRAIDAFGRVDVLVFSAGHLELVPFAQLDEQTVLRMLLVHTVGPMFAAQAVLPAMKDRGFGRIVCISSAAAMKGSPDHHHYAAAKAGVLGFVRSLSREVAPHGVTVNAVLPGAIDTPALRGLGELSTSLAARIPVGRLGEADEVASVIEFLASPAASYVTGACLLVTGGEYV